MKRILTAYLALAFGIPALLALSCVVFRGVPVGPFVLFGVPVVLFAVFFLLVLGAVPGHRFLHVVAGIICTAGSWFLSVLALGVIGLFRSGLEGIQ